MRSDHAFAIIKMLAFTITVSHFAFAFTIWLDLGKDSTCVVKYISNQSDVMHSGKETRNEPFDVGYNESAICLILILIWG